MRRLKSKIWFIREFFNRLLGLSFAVAMTLILFLVLPLMQHLSAPPKSDLELQTIDTAKLDAPPPPPQEEKQEEPKPDEKPPELTETAQPLDLSQLELALNPMLSEGLVGGDFVVKLNTAAAGENKQDVDALFSVADLDQKPRVLYQTSPTLTKEMRSKTPGTVYIVFVVDQQGRVENPAIQKSTDPVFDKAAVTAVKQWKFEPGKRNGQPVRFRMRVPLTFPKG
jgi:protein TonB